MIFVIKPSTCFRVVRWPMVLHLVSLYQTDSPTRFTSGRVKFPIYNWRLALTLTRQNLSLINHFPEMLVIWRYFLSLDPNRRRRGRFICYLLVISGRLWLKPQFSLCVVVTCGISQWRGGRRTDTAATSGSKTQNWRLSWRNPSTLRRWLTGSSWTSMRRPTVVSTTWRPTGAHWLTSSDTITPLTL